MTRIGRITADKNYVIIKISVIYVPFII